MFRFNFFNTTTIVFILYASCLVTNMALPPAAPTDIVVKMGDPGDMYASWKNPDVGSSTLEGFKVEVNRFPSLSSSNVTQLLATMPITIEAYKNWGMALGAFIQKKRTKFLVCYQSIPISPTDNGDWSTLAQHQRLLCRVITRAHDPTSQKVKLTMTDPQTIPFYNMATDQMDNDGRYYRRLDLTMLDSTRASICFWPENYYTGQRSVKCKIISLLPNGLLALKNPGQTDHSLPETYLVQNSLSCSKVSSTHTESRPELPKEHLIHHFNTDEVVDNFELDSNGDGNEVLTWKNLVPTYPMWINGGGNGGGNGDGNGGGRWENNNQNYVVASAPSSGNFAHTIGSFSMTSGKHYWETMSKSASAIGNEYYFGIGPQGIFSSGAWENRKPTSSWRVVDNWTGQKYDQSASGTIYGTKIGDGPAYIWSHALDMDTGKYWVGKRHSSAKVNTWFASGNPATGYNPGFSGLVGPYVPLCTAVCSGTFLINFGHNLEWETLAPPAGFSLISPLHNDDDNKNLMAGQNGDPLKPPTLQTNQIDGYASVRFDGGADGDGQKLGQNMNRQNNYIIRNWAGIDTGVHVFAVMKLLSWSASAKNVIAESGGVGLTAATISGTSSNPTILLFADPETAAPITVDTWHLVSAYFNGDKSYVIVDGTKYGIGGEITAGFARGFALGCKGASISCANVEYAEFAAYNLELIGDDLKFVENYFAKKYETALSVLQQKIEGFDNLMVCCHTNSQGYPAIVNENCRMVMPGRWYMTGGAMTGNSGGPSHGGSVLIHSNRQAPMTSVDSFSSGEVIGLGSLGNDSKHAIVCMFMETYRLTCKALLVPKFADMPIRDQTNGGSWPIAIKTSDQFDCEIAENGVSSYINNGIQGGNRLLSVFDSTHAIICYKQFRSECVGSTNCGRLSRCRVIHLTEPYDHRGGDATFLVLKAGPVFSTNRVGDDFGDTLSVAATTLSSTTAIVCWSERHGYNTGAVGLDGCQFISRDENNVLSVVASTPAMQFGSCLKIVKIDANNALVCFNDDRVNQDCNNIAGFGATPSYGSTSSRCTAVSLNTKAPLSSVIDGVSELALEHELWETIIASSTPRSMTLLTKLNKFSTPTEQARPHHGPQFPESSKFQLRISIKTAEDGYGLPGLITIDNDMSASLEGVVVANQDAYTAMSRAGRITGFGKAESGGSFDASTAVDFSDGVAVVSTRNAFSALIGDGNVKSWGEFSNNEIAPPTSINKKIIKTFTCYAGNAFALLMDDGSVITYGDSRYGGDSSAVNLDSNVIDIVASGTITSSQSDYTLSATLIGGAFCALKNDGSVVCWGSNCDIPTDANDYRTVKLNNNKVIKLFANQNAFAALFEDGSVVSWGGAYPCLMDGSDFDNRLSNCRNQKSGPTHGANMYRPCNDIKNRDQNQPSIVYNCDFAAELLRTDHANSIINKAPNYLKVIDIVGTLDSFCAQMGGVQPNGVVQAVCWGGSGGWTGIRTAKPYTDLKYNVKKLYTNHYQTLALFKDGQITAWNGQIQKAGGSSSNINNRVGGLPKQVIEVHPSISAWAVMDTYGHVWTFGNCDDRDSGRAQCGVNWCDNCAGSPLWIEKPHGDYNRLKELIPWEEMHSGVVQIKVAYMRNAFAILKPSLEENRGYRVAGSWGHRDVFLTDAQKTLLSNDVHSLYSNAWTFAAIMTTGKVVVWGDSAKGGSIDAETASFIESVSANVVKIFHSLESFAALDIDGNIIPWGGVGGESTYNVSIGSDFTGSKKKLNNGHVVWTFILSTPLTATELKDVTVTQTSNFATGTLDVALDGTGTTKVIVRSATNQWFDTGANLIIGTSGTLVAFANLLSSAQAASWIFMLSTPLTATELQGVTVTQTSNSAIATGTLAVALDGTATTKITILATNQIPFDVGADLVIGNSGTTIVTKASLLSAILETSCPFVKDGVCKTCTDTTNSACTEVVCGAEKFNTDGDATNGCESGCSSIPGGTCDMCTTALASGCTSVTCSANKFDTDGDATNGCEDDCSSIPDGTCDTCTTALATGCTSVTCSANKFDTDGDATNGCEGDCADVTGGSCDSCSTALATGCTAVTCDSNRFDTNNDAVDGCEVGCAAITGGTCDSCTTTLASGCTSILCDANRFDSDGDGLSCEEGCELTGVIDGTCTACSDTSTCTAFTMDEQQMNNSATEKSTLEVSVQSLTSERDTLQGEKTSLTSERDTLQGEKTSLTVERDTLQGEKTSLTSERDTLQGEKTSLTAERDTLQGEKTSLTSERDTLQGEKTSLTSERDTLQGEKTSLTDERDTLRDSLQGDTLALATERDDLKSERDDLMADKNDLMTKRDALKTSLDEEKTATKALEEEIVTLKEKLAASATAAPDSTSSDDSKGTTATTNDEISSSTSPSSTTTSLHCGMTECDALLVAQTGLDSTSMVVFGFGFFVYVVVLTFAMVVFLLKRYMEQHKEQQKKKRGGAKVQPKHLSAAAANQSESQRRLAQQLNRAQEEETR